ncbi:MAG: hypothetical protein A3B16_01430 [Candidatus Zambryskibacteria bacterium RIFCSPLOWO2_01_FULL_45_43]|uniref:Uncharacterized protein n=1 Tax=Candidatus Zambryskibacteria bacterium RIFCSPLOWO2_01_FULL_45_43 TaxID=1802762 RepID=A0A1G2U7D2_9BACT|nr:MAG: hypothetical protein A3B16_01430 [Candidatus Zambryskibacteria bacterium RIFCSPLOWO2_01_FULL_45_43]
MTKTIIAVDPGTRYWGVTVFRGTAIILSMVKILSTKGSPRKRLEEVKRIFSSLINDYAPKVLVIEKPFFFWSKQSRFLDVVIEEIKCLARKRKMKIYEFSPRTARKIVCGNGNASKKDMAKLICSIYPELKIRLNQDRRYKEIYWGHAFDSAGLGVCYLKTKQKIKCLALNV